MKESRIKNIHIVIGALLAVGLSLSLIFIALFNSPIADQFDFIADVRRLGVKNNALALYFYWSGRLAQAIGTGASYRLFGEDGAQQIIPIIFLILFGIVLSWLIYQLIKFKKNPLLFSCIVGFIMAASILLTTANLFDLYLWLDSAFVHFLGMIVIVFDLAFYIWLVKNHKNLKHKKLPLVLFSFIAFAGQSVSEITLVVTFGWSVVVLLMTFINKKWHPYRKITLFLTAILLAGSLVMILSPGLWARSTTTEGMKADFIDIFINYPLSAYDSMFKKIPPITLPLLILVSLLVWRIARKPLKSEKSTKLITVATLCFLSLTYVPFITFFYGAKVSYIENRTLSVPMMGLFVSGTILLVAFCLALDKHLRFRRMHHLLAPLALVVTIIMVVPIVSEVTELTRGYVSALVARRTVLLERDISIRQYKSGEKAEPIVKDAPVLIKGSAATDFTTNGWGGTEWFYVTMNDYYGLPENTIKVKGEKLDNGQPPIWYTEVDSHQCVEVNRYIDKRYFCE